MRTALDDLAFVGADEPLKLDPEATYSTAEARRLSGASLRQLGYWVEVGWIEGQPVEIGSGSRRRWTPEQIIRARRLVAASDLARTPLPDLADRLARASLRRDIQYLAHVVNRAVGGLEPSDSPVQRLARLGFGDAGGV
jgi:hypothetical protein